MIASASPHESLSCFDASYNRFSIEPVGVNEFNRGDDSLDPLAGALLRNILLTAAEHTADKSSVQLLSRAE
jgi:hypothetical protein